MANESTKIKTCATCKFFSVTNKIKGQGFCRVYEARHPQPLAFDPITHQPLPAEPQKQLQVYGYFKCGQPQHYKNIKE